MWSNFNSMPKILKFLTAHSMFCFVFFIISVVPSDSFSINGRHVTYAEWWSSGAGIFASLLGITGPIVGWSLLTKQPQARSWYLLFLAVACIVPYPFMGQPALALFGLLLLGAAAWYLYRWQSVQVYFAPNHSFNRTR